MHCKSFLIISLNIDIMHLFVQGNVIANNKICVIISIKIYWMALCHSYIIKSRKIEEEPLMIGTEISGRGGWVIQKAPWSNLRLAEYIF